jgi:hypothetical protein
VHCARIVGCSAGRDRSPLAASQGPAMRGRAALRLRWRERGTDDKQASMFSIVSPERRIPADHPLRRIKAMADEILHGEKRSNETHASTTDPEARLARKKEQGIEDELLGARADGEPHGLISDTTTLL